MDVGQLVWLFFILSALQPVVKQRMLESARQRLLARLERKRKTRVILLVHRQETMSLLGFPVMRYIDIDDSEDVMRAVELTDPEVPLDLVLHTPGGLVLAATQIARLLAVREQRFERAIERFHDLVRLDLLPSESVDPGDHVGQCGVDSSGKVLDRPPERRGLT